MSAIETQKRLNKVDILKLQCFDDCQVYTETEVFAKSELISPLNIRAEFIQGFDPFVKELKSKEMDQLSALKIAFTKFAVDKYQTTNSQLLKPEIDKVMNFAKIDDFISGMQTLLPELEKSHARLFQNLLGEACKKSAISCNYKTVTVEKDKEMIRVVAKNKNQQILISEIFINPESRDISIRTETIGLKGNHCNNILDRFERELSKYGITSSYKSRTLKPQNQNRVSSLSIIRGELKRKLLRLKQMNNKINRQNL